MSKLTLVGNSNYAAVDSDLEDDDNTEAIEMPEITETVKAKEVQKTSQKAKEDQKSHNPTSDYYLNPADNKFYRIDYVLAVRKRDFRGNPCYEKESAEPVKTENGKKFSKKEVRNNFIANLRNPRMYGLKIFVVDSEIAEFYLVHVPFPVLEKYANKLALTKEIADRYIKMAKKLTKQQMDDSQESHNEIKILLTGVDANTENEAGILPDDENDFTTTYDSKYSDIFEGRNSPNHETEFFTSAERIKIADYILNECSYIQHIDREENSENSEFGINLLVSVGAFSKVYPLHDSASNDETGERAELSKKWINDYTGWLFLRPLDEIRDYFGEKIGIYSSLACTH